MIGVSAYGRVLAVTLAASAASICFWPSTGNQFVSIDDGLYVSENPRMEQGLTVENAGWALTATRADFWHPVTWLSLFADASLQGTGPKGFHRTNVLLHAACAALLCLIIGRLAVPWPVAGLVAVLFAVHPQRVESVAWIAERKGLLSAFFGLACILAYVRAVAQERPKLGWPLSFFVLSLASKPVTVAMPVFLVLLDYWPLRRLQKQGLRASLREKRAFIVAAALGGALTLAAQQRIIAVASGAPLSARLGYAAIAIVDYARKTIFPLNLTPAPACVGLDLPLVPGTMSTVACLAALTFLSGVAAFCVRRRPALTFSWLWFLAALGPMLGLTRFLPPPVADRYSYFAHVGLAIGLAVAWTELSPRKRRLAAALAVQALVVCAIFWRMSARQIQVWRDDYSLSVYSVAVAPEASAPHNSLAAELLRRGRVPQALAQSEAALAIRPGYFGARNNHGAALAALGRDAQALQEFDRALAIIPDITVDYNRAVMLLRLGRPHEAEAAASRALFMPRNRSYAQAVLEEARLRQGRRPSPALPKRALPLILLTGS